MGNLARVLSPTPVGRAIKRRFSVRHVPVVDVVDVALRALPGHEFARRGMVDVHVGSGEQRGALRMLDEDGGYARLRLSTPLPLAPGDRLVLRSSGAQATVGGAVVLDVAPARRTVDARARAQRALRGPVRDHHELRLVAVPVLPHRLDRNGVLRERRRDGRQHTRPVVHPKQEVVLSG